MTAIRIRPAMVYGCLNVGSLLLSEATYINTIGMSKYAPADLHGCLLLALDGIPLFLWGILLHLVFGLHATWLVNFATHTRGSRPQASGVSALFATIGS